MSIDDHPDRHEGRRETPWCHSPESHAALNLADEVRKVVHGFAHLSPAVRRDEATRIESQIAARPALEPEITKLRQVSVDTDAPAYAKRLAVIEDQIRNTVPRFDPDPALEEMKGLCEVIDHRFEHWTGIQADGPALLDMLDRLFKLGCVKGKAWAVLGTRVISEDAVGVRIVSGHGQACLSRPAGPLTPEDHVDLATFIGRMSASTRLTNPTPWVALAHYLQKPHRDQRRLRTSDPPPRGIPDAPLMEGRLFRYFVKNNEKEPPTVLLVLLRAAVAEIASRLDWLWLPQERPADPRAPRPAATPTTTSNVVERPERAQAAPRQRPAIRTDDEGRSWLVTGVGDDVDLTRARAQLSLARVLCSCEEPFTSEDDLWKALRKADPEEWGAKQPSTGSRAVSSTYHKLAEKAPLLTNQGRFGWPQNLLSRQGAPDAPRAPKAG